MIAFNRYGAPDVLSAGLTAAQQQLLTAQQWLQPAVAGVLGGAPAWLQPAVAGVLGGAPAGPAAARALMRKACADAQAAGASGSALIGSCTFRTDAGFKSVEQLTDAEAMEQVSAKGGQATAQQLAMNLEALRVAQQQAQVQQANVPPPPSPYGPQPSAPAFPFVPVAVGFTLLAGALAWQASRKKGGATADYDGDGDYDNYDDGAT